MKRFILLGAVVSFVLLSSACKKDKNDGGGKPSITMKVNGMAWHDDKNVVAGTSNAGGTYNVTIFGRDDDFGAEASSLSIIFSRDADITTGTYNFTTSGDGASVTKVNGKTYLMTGTTSGASFTVNITGVSGSGSSKKIRGTFSGVLRGPSAGDNITITEGQFSGY